MTKNPLPCSRLLACSLLFVSACGGSSPSGGVPTGPGRARLSVEIVDAPTPKFSEVVVTVSKITAHSTVDGWVVISDEPATMDLLKLKEVGFLFGKAEISPGKLTQLRLYTDPAGPQYVTLADGSQVDLKVPSGPQSGIKINGPFELAACEETTITLDFMPEKSIHVHPTGEGDLWILRPVIKARKVVASAVGCEAPDAGDPTPEPSGDLPTGSPCSSGTECFSEFCDNGVCAPGADGAPCLADSDCSSGACLAGLCEPAAGQPAGASCTAAIECLSGLCIANACAAGAPGAPCLSASDCASGTCLAEGICAIGPAVGAGLPCLTATDCLSGTCTANKCEPGGQGTPCLAASDCLAGLVCERGSCNPQLN